MATYPSPVTDRISLALVLHNHQPVGNFGWVIAEAYERAYAPMVQALEDHPTIRVGLHYSGPLLDWLRSEQPAFLDRIAALVERGQVELLGGGYYEPVLPALPERDRVAQLVRMAEAIERLGGRRPAGAWLAERVWEPSVPTAMVDAGYGWTIVDDAHFRAAALDDHDLWGPYTTDDQGRRLTVFGSDKRLRYEIPFGRVEAVIDHLLANATKDGQRLACMGDDGEKFGAWPDTFDHCWGADGWVDRFFGAIEAAPAIALTTPSDWLAGHPPVGRIYLPTAAYFEMSEWALPADQAAAFEAAVRLGEDRHEPWVRWLRGGFWRSFQVKYREVNDLHKQMLRASEAVEAMPAGRARQLATDHLHQGQSNDCYWHGVFGGIYIPHMRLATHEHVIAAEDVAAVEARSRGVPVDGSALTDTDLDGIDEVRIATPGQLVVIDPAEGGGIGTWDVRAVRHALTAVMRRRPEAYHARLVSERGTTAAVGGSGGPATIHATVRSREPGLADLLRYDAYERRSGLVHLLAPGTTAADFAAAAATELGDSVDGAWTVEALGAESVTLSRLVDLWPAAGSARLTRRITLAGDRRNPTLDLEATVENLGRTPARLDLAIEWALTMLGGGANPAAYYRLGDTRVAHDTSGERTGLSTIAAGNDQVGIAVTTTVDPPATAWWSPIETISSSEAGFERVYQGSALVFVWPIELAPGQEQTVSVRHRVETAADRTTDELAGADR